MQVTKEVYKRKIIDEVIPAIREAWPVGMIRTETVTAQQYNARAHNIYDDPDVLAACNSGIPQIRFIAQPANSPDTNILDLGFFTSIQSLQDRTTLRTVGELVAEVKRGRSTSRRLLLSEKCECGRLSRPFCRKSCLRRATTPSSFPTPRRKRREMPSLGSFPAAPRRGRRRRLPYLPFLEMRGD